MNCRIFIEQSLLKKKLPAKLYSTSTGKPLTFRKKAALLESNLPAIRLMDILHVKVEAIVSAFFIAGILDG